MNKKELIEKIEETKKTGNTIYEQINNMRKLLSSIQELTRLAENLLSEINIYDHLRNINKYSEWTDTIKTLKEETTSESTT